MGIRERQADDAVEAGGWGCGGAETQDGCHADVSERSAEIEGGAGCESEVLDEELWQRTRTLEQKWKDADEGL